MQPLTQSQALRAIALRNNNNTIAASDIAATLRGVAATFAGLIYVTRVVLAAAHKSEVIYKVTHANVLLGGNADSARGLYERRVRKTAQKYARNSAVDVALYTPGESYYEHTDTHCIVAHKQHASKLYLYAIYNSSTSVYVHNGAVVDRQHVAQYCTKSGAAELLKDHSSVHNVTHNITHSAIVRTIGLDNVVSFAARKRLLRV